MPQMDHTTYFTQVFWFAFLVLFFVFYSLYDFIALSVSIFKLRGKFLFFILNKYSKIVIWNNQLINNFFITYIGYLSNFLKSKTFFLKKKFIELFLNDILNLNYSFYISKMIETNQWVYSMNNELNKITFNRTRTDTPKR